MLPEVVLLEVGEARLLVPAVGDEELADISLLGRGEGTGAIVVLIVALTAVTFDQMVLDGALQMAWHVVVHGMESDRHADGLAAAEHHALLGLGTGEVEVDGADGGTRGLGVGTEDGVQAMVLHGADVRVAGCIALALLPEQFVAGRCC